LYPPTLLTRKGLMVFPVNCQRHSAHTMPLQENPVVVIEDDSS
jgi:hypothetical protein